MSHRFEIRDPGLKYRYARLPGTAPKALEVGKTLTTGESSFRDGFGEPTSLERDLLRIGAAIFAADRAAARGEREDFARTIELRLPVANFARLQPLTPLIEGVLRRLSQDGWVLTLVPADAEPEESPPADAVAGKTLLFSGGLDSLAAAVEFSSGHSALDLVSHRTHNTVTSGAQTALVNGLQETGHPVSHHSFFVSSSDVDDVDHDVETTQRTRSFLFLVLGGLVARRTGRREILYMAENGQMAIHLPLTEARIGAFSTHTAHPDVLVEMQKFLSIALAVELKIENPYVLRTKGEVVAVVHSKRPHLIAQSTSCWKNARVRAGATHCGECIPCYVRRIAIESHCADGWESRHYKGHSVWAGCVERGYSRATS